MDYELIVVGASWGGFHAVGAFLESLGPQTSAAVVIAQHRSADGGDELAELLQSHTELPIRDAEDKDPLVPGTVLLAPQDYHLLIESGGTLALSTEARVQFARPSIDVLFESAADAYREKCIGVVLTGANEDGAAGLARIKRRGGVAIVQDPRGAERGEMPAAAIAATDVDVILPLAEIGAFIRGLLLLETMARSHA
ncbi:MAG: two-component system, chemotaxis family, protein-glutamate methylesterase/glutaminase [Gaiellaceae bacterium]|jgi:two-component system chemotaxis response regulator CheB|nr:two-component system, chemotaxis family, protein-glutamate methylesterase/glutaminase [Gaiellaceae bacterium]